MMTKEELGAVITYLGEKTRGLDLEHPNWLGSDEIDVDQGESYCSACGEAEAKKLSREHPREETGEPEEGDVVYLDGGWGSDDDTCTHCTECGTLLAYSLTSCGVESELNHYLTSYNGHSPLSQHSVEDPEECYRLLRIFRGDCEKEEERILVLAGQIKELIDDGKKE
jgi:hypothetical protein